MSARRRRPVPERASFWKLIESRRKERTLTLAEMRKRVGAKRPPRKSKR